MGKQIFISLLNRLTMKTFVLSFLLIACFLQANAQTFNSAVDYNDFIVSEQNKIGEKILVFNQRIGEAGITKEVMTEVLEDLLRTANTSILAVKDLSPYEGGEDLKQASVDLFQFYARLIDHDFREIINIIFTEELDDAAMTRLNDIVKKVQTDEAVLDEHFGKTQNAFAERHNMELKQNELQEKLDNN
jgi:hypothetical protein